MKPTERLSRTLATQAKKDASPDELAGIFDAFPELGEDEARAILEYREGEAPQEDVVQAVASTVADLAAVVDMDPRQLMDEAMGMLTEAVDGSAAQQALAGESIGALEQEAREWADGVPGGGGDGGTELSESGAEEWAAELDPDPEPLSEDADTTGPFDKKRDFGHNPT